MSYADDRFGPSGPPENVFKTKDPVVLASVQSVASEFRQWEIQSGQYTIRGEFDSDHFKRTHAYLMQDTYQWAGKTRQDTNDTALRDRTSEATGSMLAFEKPGNVNNRLDEISQQLKQENGLRGLEKGDFITRLASYYDQYNQVAPFRGGNEATLNTLTEQIAKGAGYDVRLDQAPTLRIEADKSLEQGSKGTRAGLEAALARVTEPTLSVEGELLRRPSLREQTPEPTRRSHEVDNARDTQQYGLIIAGRVGGRPESELLKQSVDEITSGNISSQNLQVVRQISNSVKGRDIDPIIEKFEKSTANLAELKGYYTPPTPERGQDRAPERGYGGGQER